MNANLKTEKDVKLTSNEVNSFDARLNKLLSSQVNEKIEVMESEMVKHDQVEIPVTHKYINGMYAREILIPEGTLLTGRVHKYGYVDIMLSGEITVATPDGVKKLSGTNIFEGFAGRKRAGYAHTDVKWITVHNIPDESHANDDFLEDMTFFSMKEFKEFAKEENSLSFKDSIKALGFTEKEVREQSLNNDDISDSIDNEFDISESSIEGKGVFSKIPYSNGDIIGKARDGEKRTVLGRYVNHSYNPNIKAITDGDNVIFKASRSIGVGDELTNNYRQTVEIQRIESCQQ